MASGLMSLYLSLSLAHIHTHVMGNTASCAPSWVASGGAVRVIGVDGSVERHAPSTRAADIMEENPGHFVCDSDHLSVGCRIPGLQAQEELERRRLYYLLPVDMLYSVLTEEEMASLARSASGSLKRRRGRAAALSPSSSSTTRMSAAGKRILPLLSDFCLHTAELRKAQEPKRVGGRVGGVGFSWQRSWKPALDTIEEVP